jgi:putative restriction endonuclease
MTQSCRATYTLRLRHEFSQFTAKLPHDVGVLVKAVFDVKPSSGYDDDITQRYRFPGRRDYIDVAYSLRGGWVIFRQPLRNGGRGVYFAMARVVAVEPDPSEPGHFHAFLEDFQEFATPVPFAQAGRYAEADLRNVINSKWVGPALQGKAMRQISEEDFDAVVLAGLRETLAQENVPRLELDFPMPDLRPLHYAPGFAEDADRRVEQLLVNRKVRDANFRLQVCRAYGDRCAVTGLRIMDRDGHVEADAAHIKSVADGGPDVVRNGIAILRSFHWLLDHYLISISENYRVLVSTDRVPVELQALFRPWLHLPSDRNLWPHPTFVAHHRDNFFRNQ